MIEPLSNIEFEEFMDKIVTKTPVVVNNPIVELFASEKMDVTFPWVTCMFLEYVDKNANMDTYADILMDALSK